jgi:hypothetical protein
MVGVAEASGTQGTPLEAAIKLGLDTLSLDQTITFNKYVRLVLPLDGFVFWVKAGLVASTHSALYNTSLYNEANYNAPYLPPPDPSTLSITIQGSLHYATMMQQESAENFSINQVVFTAESKIDAFNQIGPNVLYIAEPLDPPLEGIRFAFSQRAPYYEQANLYHYSGQAIYADMETQIIDEVEQINTSQQIVSNSLPIWLSMNNWDQMPWDAFGNDVPLFPSFLAQQNLRPPFGTVHIGEEDTEALQDFPTLGPTYSHSQLCRDKVRITFYGLNNNTALGFQDFVNQFSTNYGTLGITNMPVMRDEKRQQTELLAIAQKKSILFDVTYNQSQARNIARQLIKRAIPSYIFGSNLSYNI